MPGEFLVTAIKRMDGIIIPEAHTLLKNKDTLMAVVKVASLNKVRGRFQLK
jgi:Trk K+ transport system NAD-binding subunit